MSPWDPTPRTLELVQAEPLAADVLGMTFVAADGAPLAWRAGQFVELLVPTPGGVIRQPYSIASAPDPARPGRLELAVALSGKTARSARLDRLRPGARLAMVGPHGTFTRDGLEVAPTLLVGGGTGAAPLRAMAQDALAADGGPPVALLLGCRSERDLLWGDELVGLASRHPRFRFEPTLSRPSVAWAGRRGHVQAHLEGLLVALGRSATAVFVCGPKGMVRAVRGTLDQLEHPPSRVRVERYG